MLEHPLIEESFIKSLCKESVPVSIFLINGIKLHGVITDMDERTIMLKNGITQMIYKHAISTVVPSRQV